MTLSQKRLDEQQRDRRLDCILAINSSKGQTEIISFHVFKKDNRYGNCR